MTAVTTSPRVGWKYRLGNLYDFGLPQSGDGIRHPCWERMLKLDSSAFIAQQSLVDALSGLATQLLIERDEVLFNQGEEANAVYILHSGEATLNMTTPNGENVLHETAFAASLFGLPGVVGGMPYSLTVTAHAGAKVSAISREVFSRIMMDDPTLAVQVLQVLAAEVRSARNAILVA